MSDRNTLTDPLICGNAWEDIAYNRQNTLLISVLNTFDTQSDPVIFRSMIVDLLIGEDKEIYQIPFQERVLGIRSGDGKQKSGES